MVKRILRLSTTGSSFLFGPRQTGKSTLIQSTMRETDLFINLLPQRDFIAYAKEPGRFRDEVLTHWKKYSKSICYVDEVQKIPELLDEVHDLIERHRICFVLTGSSARKLKRGGSNLLAGRALTYYLFPLTAKEIGESFDLERALRLGTLPRLWNLDEPITNSEARGFLRTYTETYLKEEIQQEGIVRRIGAFSRFLEVAAANDGTLVNFSTVARDCGVSVKTAQEYYQILEDTFLAHRIDAFINSVRRRLVSHPKYYFFDPGVTNALCGSNMKNLNPVERGRRFEQWGVLQIITCLHYKQSDLRPRFWRTNTGTEVDLILVEGREPKMAIEFKSSPSLSSRDWRALQSFQEDYPQTRCFVIVPDGRRREVAPRIEVVSCNDFLEEELS